MTTCVAEGSELVLKYPCYGLMNIKQFNQQMLDSKQAPFKIIDISPSRMGFRTYLSLPINENVIWCFQFKFYNEVLSVCGVLRERSLHANGYVYSVDWLEADRFTVDNLRKSLSYLEHKFKYQSEKAVRGYVNASTNELDNKVSMDVMW